MQFDPDQYTVRLVDHSDRQMVQGLLEAASRQHRHLDWVRPLDLLGQQPFIIATQKGLPVGLLACPPDPPDVAWIRLLAVASGYPLPQVWQILWQRARAELVEQSISTTAALVIPAWLASPLEKVGFEQEDSVLFLEWAQSEPPSTPDLDLPIQPLLSSNLVPVANLDARAFDPLWRHSLEALQQALHHANYATVLRRDDQIIGYQISTLSQHGGHLARLAIDPEYQGQGLASYIVTDALRHFHQHGHGRVTVNTQGSNQRSQTLYQRLGFSSLNQEFPVYTFHLNRKGRL